MLNNITIMGRLVADPTTRKTSNGTTVTNIRIACDREYAGDQAEKKADFIDCVAWRKTAEFIDGYFVKGKPILINGRLQIRDWTDKTGAKRQSAEIVINEAFFCGGDTVKKATAGPTAVIAPVENPFGDMSDCPFDMNDDTDLPL